MSYELLPGTPRWVRDLVRFLVFAGFGAGLYLFDSTNMVVLQAFGIGTFLVMGSHLTRRLLFSKLDLQSIAVKACASPMGAAVVFATICGVLVAIMHIGMAVLK